MTRIIAVGSIRCLVKSDAKVPHRVLGAKHHALGVNRPECTTEPLPPTFCQNGSRVCPQTFGDFGSLNAFTSILGMFYYNTSLLAGPGAPPSPPGTELWQWESVIATKVPAQCTVSDRSHAAVHCV